MRNEFSRGVIVCKVIAIHCSQRGGGRGVASDLQAAHERAERIDEQERKQRNLDEVAQLADEIDRGLELDDDEDD